MSRSKGKTLVDEAVKEVEEVEVEAVEEVIEEVVSETEVIVAVEEVEEVIEAVVSETEAVSDDTKGEVHNCLLLNVRSTPTRHGEVVSKLSRGDVVNIELSDSTELFYRIEGQNNVSGFCMRNFIRII